MIWYIGPIELLEQLNSLVFKLHFSKSWLEIGRFIEIHHFFDDGKFPKELPGQADSWSTIFGVLFQQKLTMTTTTRAQRKNTNLSSATFFETMLGATLNHGPSRVGIPNPGSQHVRCQTLGWREPFFLFWKMRMHFYDRCMQMHDIQLVPCVSTCGFSLLSTAGGMGTGTNTYIYTYYFMNKYTYISLNI